MKIAVFVDENGKTLPFGSSGMVEVYEKKVNTDWHCINKIPFEINAEMNLQDIQKRIYAMTSYLRGCKTFVIQKSAGIFNAILEEKLHIRLFVVEGNPLPLFDQIRDFIKSEIRDAINRIELNGKKKESIVPVPAGNPSEHELHELNLELKPEIRNDRF
jgi:hypothetical protein